MGNHVCFTVADRSYFALLKKDVRAIAIEAGFTENKVGEIDIIVAEIVSNLVKHGNGGKLLVKKVQQDNIEGIEIIGIDNGQGINDLNRMMTDGVSTTNTLGHGLGAIKRLSHVFQVYSQKNWGTVVLSRVFREELAYRKKGIEVRTVIVPKPGETKCGDGFFCNGDKDGWRFFLGDGLGHGIEASIAVNAAIEAYSSSDEASPAEAIKNVHLQIKKTRGLVGTIVHYAQKDKRLRICGVGNIATRLAHGIDIKTPISYNGIIGHNIPNSLKDYEIAADEVQLIIMCSDGIRTKWDLWKYPALFKYDLSIIASVIFKDFGRNTDDMSVVAVRLNF
jgi:anti-sigma regulatory factor (Ser/Thr protein kinase)